jgi:hypothetical protein
MFATPSPSREHLETRGIDLALVILRTGRASPSSGDCMVAVCPLPILDSPDRSRSSRPVDDRLPFLAELRRSSDHITIVGRNNSQSSAVIRIVNSIGYCAHDHLRPVFWHSHLNRCGPGKVLISVRYTGTFP